MYLAGSTIYLGGQTWSGEGVRLELLSAYFSFNLSFLSCRIGTSRSQTNFPASFGSHRCVACLLRHYCFVCVVSLLSCLVRHLGRVPAQCCCVQWPAQPRAKIQLRSKANFVTVFPQGSLTISGVDFVGVSRVRGTYALIVQGQGSL